jgi:hypothetical protein
VEQGRSGLPVLTQSGSGPREMARVSRSIFVITGAKYQINVASDASRVDPAVCGDVVDLAAGNTDIH